MRLNVHGILGVAIMGALLAIGVTHGWQGILTAALLIVAYGGIILSASPIARIRTANDAERDDVAEYRVVVQLWLAALHVALLLAAAAFLLYASISPSAALLALPTTPFVVFTVLTLVGLCITPTPSGPLIHARMTAVLLPLLLLICVGAATSWSPLWYAPAAGVLYIVLLAANLRPYTRRLIVSNDNERLPWPLMTHPALSGGKVRLRSPMESDRLRFPLELTSALTIVSLGLLIDVADTLDLYTQSILWIGIFAGAALAGYALPMLLLIRR